MLKAIASQYSTTLFNISQLIAFSDLDQAFGYNTGTEYDLSDPHKKAAFFILFLYSMEPPLYHHVNKACIKKDEELLPLLGPFAMCLHSLLDGAEANKRDVLELGFDNHKPHANIIDPLGVACRSFIVFRGASLSTDTL